MKMENKKERRVAYHEAGHVLLCILLRVKFRIVTIKPNKHSPYGCVIHYKIGRKMWQELCWSDTDKTDQWYEAQAIISLAGGEATKLVCGKRMGHEKDYEEAMEDAIKRVGEGETANAYIKYLKLLTRDALKRHSKFLDKIAKELLVKKTLTHKEVKELVEIESAKDFILE